LYRSCRRRHVVSCVRVLVVGVSCPCVRVSVCHVRVLACSCVTFGSRLRVCLVRQLLRQKVELVLTAHPTEVNRRTLLQVGVL
jgi:hypothetical protein